MTENAPSRRPIPRTSWLSSAAVALAVMLIVSQTTALLLDWLTMPTMQRARVGVLVGMLQFRHELSRLLQPPDGQNAAPAPAGPDSAAAPGADDARAAELQEVAETIAAEEASDYRRNGVRALLILAGAAILVGLVLNRQTLLTKCRTRIAELEQSAAPEPDE